MTAGHYQFTSLVPAADDNKPSQPAALQSRPELESQFDTHTLRRRQSFTYAYNSLDLPTQQVLGWAPLGQPPGGAALQQTPPAALHLVVTAAATEGAAPAAAAAHDKMKSSQKTSPVQPLARAAAPVLKADHRAELQESVAQGPSAATISAPSALVLHDTGNPQASRMDEMAKGLSQHTGKAGSGTSLIQRRKAESAARKQAHAAPSAERASSSAATLQQAASVTKPVSSGRLLLSVQKQAAAAKVAVSSESLAPVGSKLGEVLPKGQ